MMIVSIVDFSERFVKLILVKLKFRNFKYILTLNV